MYRNWLRQFGISRTKATTFPKSNLGRRKFINKNLLQTINYEKKLNFDVPRAMRAAMVAISPIASGKLDSKDSTFLGNLFTDNTVVPFVALTVCLPFSGSSFFCSDSGGGDFSESRILLEMKLPFLLLSCLQETVNLPLWMWQSKWLLPLLPEAALRRRVLGRHGWWRFRDSMRGDRRRNCELSSVEQYNDHIGISLSLKR